MRRPADWTPIGLAADPVPGDPDLVDEIGRMHLGTADSIDRAATDLIRMLDDRFGQAEAIDAIRGEAEDVAGRIRRAEERYRGVGEAMVAYAPALRTAQTESARALQRAIDGQSAAMTAERMADYHQARIDDPATPPANLAAHQSQLASWVAKRRVAGGDIDAAEAELADAVAGRDAAAGAAVNAIRLVESTGDLNDSWWDDVVGFVDEHKATIDLIVNIVGWVATAVMVVALFIPGLNLIVGIVATIAAVITLANAALQFSAGTMGPVEALLNVGLAALTFVGGRAIASSLQGLATTSRTAVATSMRNSAASLGRGMTQGAALSRVTTAISVSRPQQLALLERLRYLALDYKTVSAIRSIVNIEFAVSGRSATQIAVQQQLDTLATRALVYEGGMLAGGQIANAAGSIEDPLPWRVGGHW